MPVRVRYAPSPTGDPHVGNIRTAIFNWLLVQRERQQGNEASFIVRIEDTDQSRLVEGALNNILEALRWLGLDWDEGPDVGGPHAPYFQSQRLGLYRQAADALLASGSAYRCYCSPERLDEMRRGQMERKESPGYDRRCRELDEPALETWRSEQGQDVPVIRFRAPRQGTTACNDIIRGEVASENQLLDDFVLMKSDGFPTYHLANVVDDHAMQISHVLRAEEWLSSLPRHKLLYDALGYAPPLFAHLPMILGPDRAKLSKRHGAASALEYKRLGYLPEAMLNFLALLGWSLDSHTEVMDREQLVTHFGLDRVSKAGAIFNQEKLDWLNGVYIRGLSREELARRMLPFLDEGLPAGIPRPLDEAYLQDIVPLVQERLKTLADAPEMIDYFFLDALSYDPALLVGKQMTPESTLPALDAAAESLANAGAWNAEALEGVLRPLADALELKTRHLFGAVRVAVTGRAAAPPLFETMEVLGRERCLSRLAAARRVLQSVPTV